MEKKNSPALTPEVAAAFLRPFFLMMKLAPMNPLDSKAKTTPFILSSEKPMSNLRLSFLFSFFSSSKSSNHKLFQIILVFARCEWISSVFRYEVGNSYGVNHLSEKKIRSIFNKSFINLLMWINARSAFSLRKVVDLRLWSSISLRIKWLWPIYEVIYDVGSIINHWSVCSLLVNGN